MQIGLLNTRNLMFPKQCYRLINIFIIDLVGRTFGNYLNDCKFGARSVILKYMFVSSTSAFNAFISNTSLTECEIPENYSYVKLVAVKCHCC